MIPDNFRLGAKTKTLKNRLIIMRQLYIKVTNKGDPKTITFCVTDIENLLVAMIN